MFWGYFDLFKRSTLKLPYGRSDIRDSSQSPLRETTAMRIDSSLNSSINFQAPAPQAPDVKVPDIRVSFDPIQREDMSARGMLLWMQRQLGIGGQVDKLA